MQNIDLTPYLKQIHLPEANSTKGDNGKVLVLGGSRLFHAASFWSASMASRIVDMVHFTSPVTENNDLMRVRAKSKFWDGIVIPYEEIDHYIDEDDTILIGPGMERGDDTKQIINQLLSKYPDKKWVVDGGALQEVDPTLLRSQMIITPNHKELSILSSKLKNLNTSALPCTTLAKGQTDTITPSPITITGGSPGLTKGGTGDVLAGLTAALYTHSDPIASCVVSSYVTKQASEEIELSKGSSFTPNDLINQIPLTLNQLFAKD